MAWAAVASTVVGGVVNYMGQRSARKAERKQMAAQREGVDVQKEGLDFSKEQYADWKSKYDPVFADMMAEIDSGITPDYAAIAGDVNKSFDTAQGMERRNMMRYGVRPQDGAYNQSERDYGIARSTAHSGIRNQARQASAGIKFNRLSGIHNALQGAGTTLAGQVGNSYSRVGNANQNMAGAYGNMAANRRSQAAADAAGWGTAIGGIDWAGAYGAAKNWFNRGGGPYEHQSRGGYMYGPNTGTQGPPAPSSGGGGGYQSPWDPSDIRLKKNVKLVGVQDGIKLYTWDWNEIAINIGINEPTFGVIAQEHLDSGFVTTGKDGYLMVDYDGLFGRRIH